MARERRQVLRLCGVAGFGILGGCADSSTETQPSTPPAETDQSTLVGDPAPPEPGAEEQTPEESTPEPNAEWATTFGSSSGGDVFYDVGAGSDGGYLFVGGTAAGKNDIGPNQWLLKVTDTGAQEWEATPTNAEGTHYLTSAMPVDNSYLISGLFSATRTTNAKASKYSTDGTLQWSNTYAGHYGWDILPGVSDGYLLVGTELGRVDNGWLQKFDSDGNDQWAETITGSEGVSLAAGDTTSDGYILAGKTDSRNPDGYLVTTDTDGAVQWSQTLTRDVNTRLNDVIAVDGGYVAVGVASGLSDAALAIHVDGSGSKQWSTVITNSESGDDRFNSVFERADGSLYAVGVTDDGDSGLISPQSLVVELDTGGEKADLTASEVGTHRTLNSIIQTDGGSFVLAGSSGTSDREFPAGWAIKTAAPLDVPPSATTEE